MCWKYLMGLPGVLWCIGLLGDTVASTSSVILCLLYAKTVSYLKDRAKALQVKTYPKLQIEMYAHYFPLKAIN